MKTNQGKDLVASPFKIISATHKDDRPSNLKEIRSIQQQNNLTNKNFETNYI